MIGIVGMIVISFLLVFLALAISITRQKTAITGIRAHISSGLIFAAFLLLSVTPFFARSEMLFAIWAFAIIAGTACQSAFADPYLLKQTLAYEKPKWFFMPVSNTPGWMAILWGVALMHLGYSFYLINELLSLWQCIALFLIGGAIYFYLIELIVGNYTHWWRRRNCRQPLNVANYAIVAEGLTLIIVVCVLLLLFLIADLHQQLTAPLWAVYEIIFVITGLAIAYVFRLTYKHRKNQA